MEYKVQKNVDLKTSHELWTSFFRLSWSLRRYQDLLSRLIVDEKSDSSSSLDIYPSRFLCGTFQQHYSFKDISYDTMAIYIGKRDADFSIEDYMKFSEEIIPWFKKFDKREKVYDIYSGQTILLLHQKNPKILGSEYRGRIFLDTKEYIYHNPKYPRSFYEDSHISDLPITPLASELMVISSVRALSSAETNISQILSYSNAVIMFQKLRNMKKYSYLFLYEMISKLRAESSFNGVINRHILPFIGLKKKRNGYIKMPVYQDLKNFQEEQDGCDEYTQSVVALQKKMSGCVINPIYQDLLNVDNLQRENEDSKEDVLLLLSTQKMIEELTGMTYKNIFQKEFEEMKEENIPHAKNSYLHVIDDENLTDRIYFVDEQGKPSLVDEATKFYPLEYEEKMFEFIHVTESIYNGAVELATKEEIKLDSSVDKINYLKDKGILSSSEAKKFKEYYIPLRNKLAHENIPYDNESEDANSFKEKRYKARVEGMTRKEFYREYKKTIEVDLGTIYYKLCKILNPQEEIKTIAKKSKENKRKNKNSSSKKTNNISFVPLQQEPLPIKRDWREISLFSETPRRIAQQDTHRTSHNKSKNKER